jgi:hypothetical protein
MSGLIRRTKKAFLDADCDLLANNIKAILVDLAAMITAASPHVKAITGATNASPAVLTITGHGWTTGDIISISGVGGNTAVNGRFRFTSTGANTGTLTDIITGAAIAGNGAYTSGGYAINLTTLDFLNDVDASARLATSGNMTTKNTDNGRFDCDNFTWTAVPTGDTGQAVMFYDDTPAAESGKFVIHVDDQASNLPVNTNNGDIEYQVHANGLFDL